MQQVCCLHHTTMPPPHRGHYGKYWPRANIREHCEYVKTKGGVRKTQPPVGKYVCSSVKGAELHGCQGVISTQTCLPHVYERNKLTVIIHRRQRSIQLTTSVAATM
eukprot:scpid112340/ scgid13097/ 